jgi:hypothetical protein
MTTPRNDQYGTKHLRLSGLGRLAVGTLVAAGVALAAGSPAMADKWNNPGHNKHWHNNGGGYYYTQNYYYQPRPQVVYVQPRPVYVVQPAPVYVAPPPPPVYYQPAPVYHRPSISIVLPIHID